MKPTSFFATVESNTYIAKETRETTFNLNKTSENSPEISFSAGQFFNIILKNPENSEKKIMRAYSVASSPEILPTFKLCVKVLHKDSGEKGIGSGFIDDLTKGETVEFSGPFGHFGQKFPEKKCIMVATGTGIAPMKAIIDTLVEKKFPKKTTLIFGVREEEYAFYREYFEELDQKFLNFSFELYISRPEENTVFSDSVKKGRVTEFFGEESKTPQYIQNTEILICGNPAMVKEVRKILKEEKHVEKQNICVEAY